MSRVPVDMLLLFYCLVTYVSADVLWGNGPDLSQFKVFYPPTGKPNITKSCPKCKNFQTQRGVSDFDKNTSTWWEIRVKIGIISKIVLFGYNFKDGKNVEFSLPFTKYSNTFGMGVWGLSVENNASIVALGPIGKHNPKTNHGHALVRIDRESGSIQTISDALQLAEPQSFTSTLDVERGIFYTIYQANIGTSNIIGISTHDGSILFDEATNVYTLNYDYHRDVIWGIGLAFNEERQFRTLVQIDPTNNVSTTKLNFTSSFENLPATSFAENKLAALLIPAISPSAANLVLVDVEALTLEYNHEI
eukprot:UC4_evm1s755